jgi:hypothetical protein
VVGTDHALASVLPGNSGLPLLDGRDGSICYHEKPLSRTGLVKAA